MDAIVLAGGLGTRLRAVVSNLPKTLAPVNGRPFLDIPLGFLDSSGLIDKVVLAVGYMSEKIVEEYSNRRDFGFRIEFSVEKEPLGTGGAIKKALCLVDSNEVLALNGDSFAELDIQELLRFHKVKDADMSIALKRVIDAGRFGSVILDESTGRVTAFKEKSKEPISGFINAGVYLFNRGIFDTVEAQKNLSIETDLFPDFVHGRLFGLPFEGRFIDIGIPETYTISSEYLRDRTAGRKS